MKLIKTRLISLLCITLLFFTLGQPLYAHPFGEIRMIDSQPLDQWWLTTGFASYHFDRHQSLNGNNYGLGMEYHFSSVNALTVGRFYNSDRQYSNYAGLYYQPFSWGPLQMGIVAGGFNGYSHVRDGGWFLAAVPVVSAHWDKVGVNIAIVPSIHNRLYGAISLQLKINMW